MKKNANKPNKKKEIMGRIIGYIGIAMILLRIFLIKEMALLIIGIILFFVGAVVAAQGQHGNEKALEKMYEAAFMREKIKAKVIAKAIKEELKDEEK